VKKQNIVKSSREFTAIIKDNRVIKSKYFSIYIKDNTFFFARFGISIPTKTGNAVTRNKLKRQIKNIIDNMPFLFSNSKDYIIITRKEITNLTFEEIKLNFEKLVSNMEEKDEEKKY